MDKDFEAIGQSALDSIRRMVAPLDPDFWERLEELRDRKEEGQLEPGEAEELEELEDLADGMSDEFEARERIQEDALSVEVRTGWHTPGENGKPDEYMILLSTGGPASRIVGDLNEWGGPTTARLEVQDWFKPWTFVSDSDEVLAYADCFYFGE